MAHAVAPQANIILFEANSDWMSDLMTAVKTAATQSGASVVSMSWGVSEYYGETSYDSYFTTANVDFLASTGDDGAPGEYPAFSPNVIAVGGTTLSINSSTYAWASEKAWSDGGGGSSLLESEPSYQDSLPGQPFSGRETPNVSFDANPNTGVAVYDSYDFGGAWAEFGGTSVSAPCWSGLIAIADQFHAAEKISLLNGPSALYALSNPYTNGYFHDITNGNNGYAAGTGYDMASGIGSPIANVLIPALALRPTGLTAAPVSATQINLNWTAPIGAATGYNVYRGTSPGAEGSSPINGALVASTAYNDTTASAGTTYYYTVRGGQRLGERHGLQ